MVMNNSEWTTTGTSTGTVGTFDQSEFLFSVLPYSIAVFDRDMRYLKANRQWVQDYGLDGIDVVGRSQYEVLPNTPQFWREIYNRALRGETVLSTGERAHSPNGDVEFLSWRVFPWYTKAGGQPNGIVVINTSITAVQFEREAKLSKAAQDRLNLAELLSTINTRLSRATNEQEILSAIAAYIDQQHPQRIILSYHSLNAEGRPVESSNVAIWENGSPQPDSPYVALKVQLDDPISKLWIEGSEEVLFIEDFVTDKRADAATRSLVDSLGVRSMAVIPLRSAGRWQGVISAIWAEPHVFSGQEQFMYTELARTVASVVASRRAYLDEEATRLRAETLSRINAALAQATTEREILSAVATYISGQNPQRIILSYLTTNEQGRPFEAANVGIWENGALKLDSEHVTLKVPLNDPISKLWIEGTEEVLFVEDFSTDPRADDSLRALIGRLGLRSLVGIPLRSGGQWQGVISATWLTPHTFTDEERYIYTELARTAASVVASRRAYLTTQTLLQASEDRLRLVINNAPIALHTLDKEGSFTLSEGKALAIMGHRPGEIVGRSYVEIYHDSPASLTHIREALDGKETSWTSELAGTSLQHWYMPAYDDGKVSGVIGVAIDITERRRAEKERESLIRQLREASRFKDEFFAMMSHELRTPLNAMIGLLGLIQMEDKVDEDTGLMISRARANSERLLSLINNILDISRMEAGRLQIVPSRVSLRQVVEKLTANMAVLANQKSLDFRTTISESLQDNIIIDEDALTKILTNLLANAFKFTQAGSVSLDIARDNDKLVIKVQDTGIGIPEHMQEVIFESFRQVDSSSTRAHGGTGLGLSIVHNLCVALNGVIRVDSKPGQGSTFTAVLPLHIEPALQERTQ